MSNFFGLQNHSPTALNLAAASLPLYFVEKVLKRRGSGSCAMFRGTSSETGIVHGLVNPSVSAQSCIDMALSEYDRLSALSPDPKKQKERDAIPGIVEQGLIALKPYGIPDEIQLKLVHELPGVSLPVLGFCDLGWTQHGIRLDIKTQLSLSSDISEGHARQISYYLHNSNYTGRIGYLSPKKHGVYEVKDATGHVDALRQIAMRVEKFLSLSKDPTELAGLLIPDYTSFYFNDPVTRANCRDVFGF